MSVLGILAWVDAKTGILPDGLLGFLVVFSVGLILWGYPWYPGLITAGLMAGSLIAVQRLSPRPLLGWGDVKLLSLCAFVLPMEALGTFLFVCGVFGTLQHRIFADRGPLPFGPVILASFSFLCMSTL